MYRYVNNSIFIITIIFCSILFFITAFPNYIIGNTIEYHPENFENDSFSISVIPILISNIIFVILFILYKREKLPSQIYNIAKAIQSKDISKKTAYISLVIILTIYIIFSIGEFSREEFEFGDYNDAKDGAEKWEEQLEGGFRISPIGRYFILFLSLEFLGNIRILPFVASIGFLILTYFLTKNISGKRSAGLAAFIILIQSNSFLLYDTTSTYENFWTFFYFLSLFLIIKDSSFSSVSYAASLFLKPLVVVFIPINIFWVFIDGTRKAKIITGFSLLGIIGIILFVFFTGGLVHTHADSVGFNQERFILSFNEIINSLRFDTVILIILIPVVTLLFINSKNNKKSLLVLFGILITLLSQPLLFSITDITIQPYRFIPVIVFVSIGFGIICCGDNKQNQLKQDQL